MAKNPRLDQAMLDRNLCETRSRAKAMIMAGDVYVNGQKETRAGHPIAPTDEITLKAKPRFVSRGGEKMDGALNAFDIRVTGMVGADFGASTGGFTDCLLQRGASKVYAIDVGYGILDERIRTDERVVVMERTNARYVDELPEPIDIVVIDVSFISLNLILPAVKAVLRPGRICVPLIKPQFEAGPEHIGKRGVVRDPAVHEMVLRNVLTFAQEQGFAVVNLIASSLRGPNGNVEFLGHLVYGEVTGIPTTDELVARAMATIPE
ncbi:MAG: TlyA family RNA methyltransferase [Thermomicrobiales bacterium]|nr:TlyA family RNA methyltransferase [Thermomicrobiales bacterium]